MSGNPFDDIGDDEAGRDVMGEEGDGAGAEDDSGHEVNPSTAELNPYTDGRWVPIPFTVTCVAGVGTLAITPPMRFFAGRRIVFTRTGTGGTGTLSAFQVGLKPVFGNSATIDLAAFPPTDTSDNCTMPEKLPAEQISGIFAATTTDIIAGVFYGWGSETGTAKQSKRRPALRGSRLRGRRR